MAQPGDQAHEARAIRTAGEDPARARQLDDATELEPQRRITPEIDVAA